MIRVLQVSDIHVAADPHRPVYGQAPEVNLAATLDAARGFERYDVVVATGDVADDASAAAYERVAAQLESVAPLRWIPGNHDDPAGMATGERLERVTDLGQWRLITVDTRWADRDAGRVGEGQLARLATFLAANDDAPVLLALHHPLMGLCAKPDCNLTDAQALLDLLDRNDNVRAVISGHLHAPFDTQRAGLRLLGAPSTCVGMRHDACDAVRHARNDTEDSSPFTDDPPAARVIELAEDGSITTRLISAL